MLKNITRYKYSVICSCGNSNDPLFQKLVYEVITSYDRLTWRDVFHRFLNLNPTISHQDIIFFDYSEDAYFD